MLAWALATVLNFCPIPAAPYNDKITGYQCIARAIPTSGVELVTFDGWPTDGTAFLDPAPCSKTPAETKIHCIAPRRMIVLQCAIAGNVLTIEDEPPGTVVMFKVQPLDTGTTRQTYGAGVWWGVGLPTCVCENNEC